MRPAIKNCVATFVCVFCMAASVINAAALEIGARGYYWFPSLKATMKAGSAGTEFNLKNDLGIGNSNTYTVEAFTGIGKHNLGLSYTPFDYSATKVIDKQIVFDKKTYGAGTSVNTNLNLRMFDAEYRYKLVDLENILAGFSISLLGKIKYLDGEAKMNSALAGEQKQTFGIPIPMVGAGLNVGLIANILEARAKATGIGYSGNYFADAIADIAVTPFPFVRISGGYRYMKIKIDNVSDTYGDLDFYGPYLGLAVVW